MIKILVNNNNLKNKIKKLTLDFDINIVNKDSETVDLKIKQVEDDRFIIEGENIFKEIVDYSDNFSNHFFNIVNLVQTRKEINLLKKKIMYDSKLDCYNFSFYDHQIQIELDNLSRRGNYFSLVWIDLDNFKSLNDSLGHPAGDDALFKVCETIKHILRVGDTVFRFGGDEFVVIIANTREEESIITAERLRKSIEELNIEFEKNKKKMVLTCSLGVVTVTKELLSNKKETGSILLKIADDALYEAKRLGRNRVVHANNMEGKN